MGWKKRVATLVGCNYAGTVNELHGCINDVLAMSDTLVSRFGFRPADVHLLTDAPGSDILPTGKNIKVALRRMVDAATPGDILFFHYSGHGTLVPSPRHKPSKLKDEAIVPCDFNLITDVDFRDLVNRLPRGVSFTMLSDSCHSGGLIDQEKEQIGPSTVGPTRSPAPQGRPRFISPSSILHHLGTTSGIESPDVGDHLVQLFGGDASAKFHNAHRLGAPQPVGPDEGILLSGCQTNETSADMAPGDEGGKAYGAFSDALQLVLTSHVGAISNRELVTRARQLLRKEGFSQHPCLYCSDENADAAFLWQTSE